MKFTRKQLEELLDKAKKATPDPWFNYEYCRNLKLHHKYPIRISESLISHEEYEFNPNLMTSMSPEVVQSLIESVIGLSEALKSVSDKVAWHSGYDSTFAMKESVLSESKEALEKWGGG